MEYATATADMLTQYANAGLGSFFTIVKNPDFLSAISVLLGIIFIIYLFKRIKK